MADFNLSDPLIGQVLDGYRVHSVLGRGGMGIVYEAEDEELARTVALKMIDPQLARDDSFVRRFRSEARTLARIDSPYIVEVHALRSTPQGLFIVMEYVDGGTVGDLLENGPIPWPQALPIIEQMLLAFEAAHGAGVIHRDIKPGNVMLTREGRVKVTDFGLAKQFVGAGDSLATRTQGIAGTLLYMSPEQVKGQRDLDHRSDLYASGMTAYQMLTGRLPIERDSGEFAIMRSIVEETLPPPSTFNSRLPSEIDRIIMHALEKSPEDRFQSAREMREAFEKFRTGGATAIRDGYEEEPTVPDRALRAVTAATTIVEAGTPAYSPPPPRYDHRPRTPDESPNAPKPLPPLRKPWGLYGSIVAIVVVLSLLVVVIVTMWPFAPDNKENADNNSGITETGDQDTFTGGGGELSNDNGNLENGLTGPTGQSTSSTGYITVNTEPSDAVIYIGGQQAISGTEVSMPAGPVEVRVERSGYTPWRQSVTVAAGESISVRATLAEAVAAVGRLVLNAPAGGTVSAGGGPQRGRISVEVPAGQRSVTFNHPQYGAWTTNVTIRAGQMRELTAYFEKQVNVGVSDVSGGNVMSAAIWVDGTSEYFAPKQLTLGPGRHTITVTKEGYDVLDSPKEVIVRQSLEASEPERLVFRIRKQ